MQPWRQLHHSNHLPFEVWLVVAGARFHGGSGSARNPGLGEVQYSNTQPIIDGCVCMFFLLFARRAQQQ